MRTPDWPEAMNSAFDAARKTPFEWGVCDCCLFTADVVLAITGIDYAADYRGSYSTQTGAARALAKRGFKSVTEAWTAALGQPVSAEQARRGDVVMAMLDGQPGVGICIGTKAVFKAKAAGLAFIPLTMCEQIWRVG